MVWAADVTPVEAADTEGPVPTACAAHVPSVAAVTKPWLAWPAQLWGGKDILAAEGIRGLQGSLPGWGLHIPRVGNQKALSKPFPCQTAVVLSVWGMAEYVDPTPASASTLNGVDITPSTCRDSNIAFSKVP